MINILPQFHELWTKTVPSRMCTRVSKISSSDLAFDLTLPNFKLDLDIMMINILTQFHELYIKTVFSKI